MEHLLVTRFSVPRLDSLTAEHHHDRRWLDQRLELFRRFYVPSVERLGVPAVLLCSRRSAAHVGERVADLSWARVVEQDDWYGGFTGSTDQMLTRFDSDDCLHEGWFEALERATPGYEVYCTRRFLRYDPQRRRLYERSRALPSPLAAFRDGRNPYACDHEELPQRYRVRMLERSFLLQVAHGANLSTRKPSWRHFRYRVPLARLSAFGIEPEA